MRISHKYKFIFFANPKTGSSSIRQFIDPISDVKSVKNYLLRTQDNLFYPHITPLETKYIFETYQWDFGDYRKFVFVRNPWARIVSLYEHIRRSDPSIASFKQWIYTINQRGSGGGGEEWERWRRYGAWSLAHYISDENGSSLVDDILRTEDINTRFLPFLKSLGVDTSNMALPEHKNKGGYQLHYSDYFDKQSCAHVESAYDFEIQEFGYKFESVND